MTAMTGFSFASADSSVPSTSSQIKGAAYAPETVGSTSPQAALDMVAAYNNGAAQGPADVTELKGGALDGLTLTKGIYKWGTTVVLGAGQKLTLDGACGDVFIFQAAGAISTGANSQIVLTGGVQSNSIYWVGATALTTYVSLPLFVGFSGTDTSKIFSGVSSKFAGIILTYTNVVIGTSATLDGAIYTQTEVALHMATITPPKVCPCLDPQAASCDSTGLKSTACTLPTAYVTLANGVCIPTFARYFNLNYPNNDMFDQFVPFNTEAECAEHCIALTGYTPATALASARAASKVSNTVPTVLGQEPAPASAAVRSTTSLPDGPAKLFTSQERLALYSDLLSLAPDCD
ncbi:hypothetical protein P7C70_g5782, partial [Phenoliferia sp. Uapishka_3]